MSLSEIRESSVPGIVETIARQARGTVFVAPCRRTVGGIFRAHRVDMKTLGD